MINLDRRVKRTQKLLASALIELTLEKGFETVTIRDITDRADVGYATFFRHYRDKHDLLQDVSDVVLDSLMNRLFPTDLRDSVQIGIILFNYVQENDAIIRLLLEGRTPIKRLIDAAVNQTIIDRPVDTTSIVPPEIAANHIVTATIALIQWWLEHQMPYPPERMGAIYDEMIARPTRGLGLKK